MKNFRGNLRAMKPHVKLLTALILTFFPSLVMASPKATSLELILRQTLGKSHVDAAKTSIAVADVSSQTELATINGDVLRNPASCTKIVTAAALLSFLGPNYTLPTDFFSSTPPQQGTIQNLYVKGTGDPFLVNEELWKIVHELSVKGLKTISGDIVIDNSFFEKNEYPRMSGESRRAYAAVTSPFAVNFNSLAIHVTPGAKRGDLATVSLDPNIDFFQIVNSLKTGSEYRLQIDPVETAQGEKLIISGTIPVSLGEKVFYRNVTNPTFYAGSILRLLLLQHGISVSGNIKEGKTPEHAHLLLSASSKPLSLLIRDMNKFSNNFTAEQLLKHLAAVKKGIPGTTAHGVEVLQEYLASIGIPRSSYTIENGSGFSSITRFTASQLVQVLMAAYHDFRTSADFVASLAVFGADGTMKDWNHHEALRGKMRAKTGSLNGVSALAGFVSIKNGDVRAFAILGDHLKQGHDVMRQIQLDVVDKIARH